MLTGFQYFLLRMCKAIQLQSKWKNNSETFIFSQLLASLYKNAEKKYNPYMVQTNHPEGIHDPFFARHHGCSQALKEFLKYWPQSIY